MSINNNQPSNNPNNQVNQGQGFTFEQKIVLLSLALVAVMVLVAFVAVLQFYQPQPQIQYVVVTATPGLVLPTADMAQNQVSNLDEPTRTPTPTSPLSPEELATINSLRATSRYMGTPGVAETATVIRREQIRAFGGVTATIFFEVELQATQRALIPTATDWPELATAKAEKQGTPLSRDEQAALNGAYYGAKREQGQAKANELGQCVPDEEGLFYYCPGYEPQSCQYVCHLISTSSDPSNPMWLQSCPDGEGYYLSCYDETLGRHVAVPLPPE